jgi:hypothetical protein
MIMDKCKHSKLIVKRRELEGRKLILIIIINISDG